MNGGRYLLTDLLVCLPLAAFLVLGVLFYNRVIPTYEAAEDARIAGAYYRTAVAIRDGEAKGVREYSREGRRRAGSLSRGSWGFDSRAEKGDVVVWYRAPKAERVRGVAVPEVPRQNLRRWFVTGGLGVFLMMLVLTDIGLNRFRRFARERDDFLRATAHDLATPLVGMRRLIGRNDDTAKVIAERMIRMVKNLNDFLRLGGRSPNPKICEFDLIGTYRAAYGLFRDDFRELADGEDVAEDFGEGVDPAAPFMVRADREMTEQIVWNLLTNALKYAAPEGPVRVSFVRRGDKALLSVIDKGKGLSRSERRRVFDRYYRAKSARKGASGGFGIGLCTARAFARAMKGDLTLAANRPRGSVFTLTLPVSRNPA